MKNKVLIAVVVVLAVAALAWLRLGPLPSGILDDHRFVSTVITDRHGETLFDGLAGDGTRTVPVSAPDIPLQVAQATLAAEDHRFHSHFGVDPIGVARALWRDVRAGEMVEGGSTITQQVAKLLLTEGRSRSLRSKVRQSVLAIRLEHRFSKEEILALYLNRAPYGNQYAGIERASRAYFGVPAKSLTTAQAALLAGLPQRPSYLNPRTHFDRAMRRQRIVLQRMREEGMLTATQYEVARAERIRIRPAGNELIAPHFVQRVSALYPDKRLQRIETTLDAGLQREVRGIISARREMLEKHGAKNVAVVVLDNRSGEWLAWEGSGDYFDEENGGAIDGALALRQPGSALKPFTYATAFERGYSPASVLPDVELRFPTAVDGVVYAPRNYDDRFRGPLLARKALAGSVNVPAVWLLSRQGVPTLMRQLRACGITSIDRTADYYGLGLTLGGAEVRLAELVAAYAAFAREGMFVEPVSVRNATTSSGEKLVPRRVAARRVMGARSAFWVTDVLSDNDARSFAFGRGGSLEFPFPVAVKTGTSQAYRDNWTIGFTREVTVGVWVGNFDRKELRNSSGVTGAAPIFHSVMLAARERVSGKAAEFDDEPIALPPPDVKKDSICLLSGMRATAACSRTGEEWVPNASASACNWHRLGVSTAADGRTRPVSRVAWPAVYASWARAMGLDAEAGSVATRREEPGSFAIVQPPDGAEYLLDPTLRGEYQSLHLKATAPSSELTWSVNGKRLAAQAGAEGPSWRLQPGRHLFRARDRNGQTASAVVTVR